jgi:hypothetical protein
VWSLHAMFGTSLSADRCLSVKDIDSIVLDDEIVMLMQLLIGGGGCAVLRQNLLLTHKIIGNLSEHASVTKETDKSTKHKSR